jgi:hypothetical protein
MLLAGCSPFDECLPVDGDVGSARVEEVPVGVVGERTHMSLYQVSRRTGVVAENEIYNRRGSPDGHYLP